MKILEILKRKQQKARRRRIHARQWSWYDRKGIPKPSERRKAKV